jgi:ubiquinone/menaquinone biosynthesis C-methylase UbiE
MYYWNDFIHDIRSKLDLGDVLLDAGAGDCHWKQYFPEAKYIGMDMAVGDSNYDYSHLDITGNLTNIPIENNAVDVIMSIQVLEHLSEPGKVLAEFNRILKQSGYLFISCPQSGHQHQVPYDFFRYTPFGLRSMLTRQGFEVVWIKPQLGNFNYVYTELSYSARKLPEITKNPLAKVMLKVFSVYIRGIFGIHKPILKFFDRFEALQDGSDGHFVMARKL